MPLTLRRATLDDVPILTKWDHDPDVISCTTDNADASVAFAEDHDWTEELAHQSDVTYFVIGELDGRPIGAMQIIDPYLEPTHYWGDIEPNLRAVDIWIGDAADRSHGHGETMMRLAMQQCFADSAVTAIVIDPLATNTRAHAFYHRLGYSDVGRQFFGEDDCLVMRISREAWQQRFPDDAR